MRLTKYFSRTLTVAIVLIITLGLKLTGSAQNALPQAAFIAYACEFQAETNSTQIHAILMGADGLPMPADEYTIDITEAQSGEALASNKITSTILPGHDPLQMILVLDTTDTVPLEEISNALRIYLAARLETEDKVALITFSETISPMTQFYTDKNRLIDDHISSLVSPGGDNRLYDAINKAVLSLPTNTDMRQTVLVITDSGRRELEQVTLDEIIETARTEDIQIYTIGFYSSDRPDEEELQALANATGGYSWLYDGKENSRPLIETAIGDFLNDFIKTLNSEIRLTVDMQGITPDANGQILLNIAVNTDNDSILTDQISCPVERLNHSIAFVNTEGLDNAIITGPVDIGVTVESDMSLEATTVAFWLNDEIVQNTSDPVYTINPANLEPGYYTVGAQLRNQNNDILATTPSTMEIFVQHTLQLTTANTLDLSKPVQLVATGNPNLTLPDVLFTVAPVQAPANTQNLSDSSIAFQADGKATLNLPDLSATIRTLFPDVTPDNIFQIQAIISGAKPEDPKLATSNSLTIDSVPPAPTSQPTAVSVTVPEIHLDKELLIPALTIFLFALNLLLLRMVGRARIKRMIAVPDDYELSRQLMSITVRRDGFNQTHSLTKRTINVGRGASNDINLGDDPKISRQHGVIIWRKNQWYYTNRKRNAKARIDSKWCRGYSLHKLIPITEIEIGEALLVFHSNAQRDIAEFIKTNL